MRLTLLVAVATARACVTLVAALTFWAAAPVAVGWVPTTVMTASMAPAIEVGDVVVARPVDRDALVPGRVALATDPDWPDRLRLHRVTGFDGDGSLVTKGDANTAPDSSPVHPDAVRGVGVLRVPFVGLPIVWLRSGDAVPLTLSVVGFAACLALALRRGIDDDETRPDGDADGEGRFAKPATGGSPAATDAARRRPRTWALSLAALVTAAMVALATPSHAALSAVAGARGFVTAGRVTPPWSLTCSDGLFSSATVSWRYDGWPARSFDMLVDGRVVLTDLPPESRSARVPSGWYSLFSTSTVTIRAHVGSTWSALSSESVRIGGALLGFGRPYCR
ncbi:signal peptidase [Microbacterium sp. SORGH_AS 1204]|uniref:hypothetical protein n=1 Tax=Microbacterium sp. SORGH_AS_1204 TaxID=3041785 RepID=UPI00278FC5B8|nr:hypothetical protein [Microbacterium sp. SORGH_AS_1204]MDQ1135578.1 signal peptidase [Microbacterium sp. SORGH_AS_1204]